MPPVGLGVDYPGHGWLDIGKTGRTGNESDARKVWRAVVGAPIGDVRLTVRKDDDQSIRRALDVLSMFATKWLDESAFDAEIRHNEHALESASCVATARSR